MTPDQMALEIRQAIDALKGEILVPWGVSRDHVRVLLTALESKVEQAKALLRQGGCGMGQGTALADVQAYVREVVQEFVAKSMAFTAWDATKEARSRAIKAGLPGSYHGALKQIVHDMSRGGDMPGYDRVLVTPPGSPAPAWLYHPQGFDPSSYAGQPVAAAPGTPTPADGDDDGDDAAVATSQPTAFSGTRGVGTPPKATGNAKINRMMSSDGILYIPRWMGEVMRATHDRGVSEVYAVYDGSEIVISKAQAPTSVRLLVDANDNIRLTVTNLNKLAAKVAAPTAATFEIEFDPAKGIIVRA